MPENFRGRCNEFWSRRTQFEKLMMGLIFIAFTIMIIVLVAKSSPPDPKPNTCKTPTCLEEAAALRDITLPSTNPCDDFHEFSCGKFWESIDTDTLGLGHIMWQHFRDIVNEPISPQDHKIVAAIKNLYQVCMDDLRIEKDNLRPITAIIKTLGGWPLLEGPNWNENNFSWIYNNYKLRKMGYYHDNVLLLTTTEHPYDENKFILKCSTEDTYNYEYEYHSWNMTKTILTIAQIFGAKDDEVLHGEVQELLDFVKSIRKIEHPQYFTTHELYTVDEYQDMVKGFNWLIYINNIIGPKAKITGQDVMLFPPPDKMTLWINTITLAPIRVLANYMVWKVISVLHVYMPCEIRVGIVSTKKDQARENFCLAEGATKFNVNPLSIVAVRRHVPEYKRKKVEELLENYQKQLLKVLKKADWLDEDDRKIMIGRTKTLKLQIGLPANYSDDKIFNNLEVDWVERNYNDSFLSLAGQFQRNYVSMQFEQINILRSESFFDKTYNVTPEYRQLEHMLYVPYIVTEGLYYNYKRPNYLNYGAMGSLIGYQLGKMITLYKDAWSTKTTTMFNEKLTCLEKAMSRFLKKMQITKWDSSQNELLFQKALGEQLSYLVYKRLVEKNGQELQLPVTNYTQNQMFWISSAIAWCHPYLPFKSGNIYYYEDPDFVRKLIGVSVGNNQPFAETFNCPVSSVMRFSERCNIF